ncbi:hypothetical protein ACFVT1_35540 [Streptomyces sp. NPDC057963]|uniref:hypothetical protein n=1 Tax=Streptomyces sp. NPDC057963 TaxID=3346290 RepID=UPI0036E36577
MAVSSGGQRKAVKSSRIVRVCFRMRMGAGPMTAFTGSTRWGSERGGRGGRVRRRAMRVMKVQVMWASLWEMSRS